MITTSADRRKRILVFIDMDIVVRAFVASKTFRELESRHDLTYVVPEIAENEKRELNVELDTYVDSEILKCRIPRKRVGYWYFLFAATALHNNRGTDNYNIIRYRKLNREMGARNASILSVIALPVFYHLFRFLFLAFMGKCEALEKLLDRCNPDIIIYPSVLTGTFMNDLVRASEKRKTPIIVCMNSWDNPSSKAVSTGTPDWLVVWGEQSKKEAIRFMGIPPEKIVAFGAAQFQLYRTPPEETHEELASAFQVPKDKEIILYAGIGESYNETKLLRILDQETQGGTLDGCHVLYRPHPWRGRLVDGEEDFFTCEWQNVSMDPHMTEYYKREISNASKKFFMIDYKITNKLLSLSSGVISPRSTLLLEAMVKGLPVLILFPEEVQAKTEFSIKMAHFIDFLALDVVNNCFDMEEIPKHLSRLRNQMDDPDISFKLKQEVEHFCLMSKAPYGERLAELVDHTLENRNPRGPR